MDENLVPDRFVETMNYKNLNYEIETVMPLIRPLLG